MDIQEELAAALRAAAVLVSYVPLSGEPDVSLFFSRHGIATERVSVPPRHDISPQELAASLRATYEGKTVYLFIPGREFDLSGTRHGRGGGWYDRFLSALPREWVRVGVLKKEQLSDAPLTRESWDEPMDMLLTYDNGGWSAVKVES